MHPMIKQLVDKWFKDQIPKDWKLNEPLWPIEVNGKKEHLSHQAFVQTVKKELEGEKKRLETLSDEEIVKEANSKIKDHLFKLYSIKLEDHVNPQDWEEVRKSIGAQMENLPGPSKARLRLHKTWELIREDLDKYKGRQNYLHQILVGMLSHFGIVASVMWKGDWDTIKNKIEKMRKVEYFVKKFAKMQL